MSSAHLKVAKLFDFTNFTALVTGGGTGIGLMIAQALAVNGAKVYITGRRMDVLKTTASNYDGNLIPLEMDATEKTSIAKCVSEFAKSESKLDLLVNNAGLASNKVEVAKGDTDIEGFSKALFEDPLQNWNDTYSTNVFGPYYVASAFVPFLTKANKEDSMHKNKKDFAPSVINICSISGITKTSQSGQFAYNTSKAATIQLTKLLATEFSRENISVRVNSIAPGYFPSEMTTSESDDKNKSHQDQTGWRKEKRVPADRSGRDEDMAQLALMLAKNSYINGQTVVVDGGLLIEMP